MPPDIGQAFADLALRPGGWLLRNFVTGAPLVAAPMLRGTGSPGRAPAPSPATIGVAPPRWTDVHSGSRDSTIRLNTMSGALVLWRDGTRPYSAGVCGPAPSPAAKSKVATGLPGVSITSGVAPGPANGWCARSSRWS